MPSAGCTRERRQRAVAPITRGAGHHPSATAADPPRGRSPGTGVAAPSRRRSTESSDGLSAGAISCLWTAAALAALLAPVGRRDDHRRHRRSSSRSSSPATSPFCRHRTPCSVAIFPALRVGSSNRTTTVTAALVSSSTESITPRGLTTSGCGSRSLTSFWPMSPCHNPTKWGSSSLDVSSTTRPGSIHQAKRDIEGLIDVWAWDGGRNAEGDCGSRPTWSSLRRAAASERASIRAR